MQVRATRDGQSTARTLPPPTPRHVAGRFSILASSDRPSGVRRLLDLAIAAGARAAVAAMRVIYAALKLLPVQDKVVLASRLYTTTSPDMALLAEELRRQRPGLRVTVLNHRNTAVGRVPAQMLAQMYHLATARACVTDSYLATISALRHRPGLTVVQMWHALGAIKRFGLAAVGSAEGRPGPLARVMRMHAGYDWVLAGGSRMIEPFAESFGVEPRRVLALGAPRVDLLADSGERQRTADRVRAAHPGLGDKPIVLYAPTFRTDAPADVDGLLAAVDPAEADVVVALHPLDARDFSGRPGVVQDRDFTTLDWLTVADHLVSDYSAVVFDAAVVGVPTWFYAYDLDTYRDRRGLFVDLEAELPKAVFRHAADLMAALLGGVAAGALPAGFVAAPDGRCTERIARLALGADPGDLS